MRKNLTALLLLVLAAGCSRQDFSRPAVHNPLVHIRNNQQRPKRGNAEDRAQRLAQLLSEWKRRSAEKPEDYILGPGDELDIAVFALEAPGETTHLKRTVASDGQVSLPWASNIVAAGRNVRQLEDAVKGAYADRYIKNPQVTVDVADHRSVIVLVTGAVQSPGVYNLDRNRSSVLEMLAKSGGLKDDAADELLVIRPGNPSAVDTNKATASSADLQAEALATDAQLVRVDLRRLIDDGDLLQNVDIGAGDIISVRSMAQQFIYVLGYVSRPGAFEMKSERELDALRAVALAGGLTATARADNSFIVRQTDEGQDIMKVDLIKIAAGASPTIYMESGDTLVVGSSAFARLSEFVRPTVGAGMSFTPAP